MKAKKEISPELAAVRRFVMATCRKQDWIENLVLEALWDKKIIDTGFQPQYLVGSNELTAELGTLVLIRLALAESKVTGEDGYQATLRVLKEATALYRKENHVWDTHKERAEYLQRNELN